MSIQNTVGKLNRDYEPGGLPVLLLVDDEPNVLRSLYRMLHGENYTIKTACNGEEGLKTLQEDNVQVIISDHNMPGMTGVEFLSEVKKTHPDTIRILLTAETNVALLCDAVNRGEIYKFLVKPWDTQTLKANISEAFNQFRLNRERDRLANDIKNANDELSTINQALQNQVNSTSNELIKISQFDSLTGLPNRMLFMDRLSQQVIKVNDDDKIYVAIIGVDRLGVVNETYGHVAGDYFIQHISQGLISIIGSHGSVARLSGDEFAVIFSNNVISNHVVDYIQNIFSRYETPVKYNECEMLINFSVGVCIYPDDAYSVDDIIKNSISAMNYSKRITGSSYHFYSSDMQRKASKRLMLENKLRHALENKEYILHYQPQLEINTRKLKGVEALLRWKSSDDTLIGPDVFIPILEDTGMIIQVGEWVLSQAMQQAIYWHENNILIPVISVNLSPRQFGMENLVETIDILMRDTGFNDISCQLEIEITESLLAEDTDKAIDILGRISSLGVSIAMDDFGTGYASLNYITQFPVDTLKIDRSFIGRLDKKLEDQAIVRAIITMAHSLNMQVVAEGVETEEQLDFLKSLNCDVIQGFLFNKPVSSDDVEKLFVDMKM
ncbi:MAG: EAL domain-containing protein [Gammaproteobacteria bacterium]|nr:EAL domain-containing protein [Gammaproteobacteria bacterium]